MKQVRHDLKAGRRGPQIRPQMAAGMNPTIEADVMINNRKSAYTVRVLDAIPCAIIGTKTKETMLRHPSTGPSAAK